jgi:hypothetical protein
MGGFTEEELEGVQRPAVRAFTRAMGHNENTPNAVKFPPKDCGGVGVQHPHYHQGAEQGMVVLTNLRVNRTLGEQTLIMPQWQQAVAGTDHSALHTTDTNIPQLVGPWLPSLRQFLTDAKCRFDGIMTAEPQRLGDRAIMGITKWAFNWNWRTRVTRITLDGHHWTQH